MFLIIVFIHYQKKRNRKNLNQLYYNISKYFRKIFYFGLNIFDCN